MQIGEKGLPIPLALLKQRELNELQIMPSIPEIPAVKGTRWSSFELVLKGTRWSRNGPVLKFVGLISLTKKYFVGTY